MDDRLSLEFEGRMVDFRIAAGTGSGLHADSFALCFRPLLICAESSAQFLEPIPVTCR